MLSIHDSLGRGYNENQLTHFSKVVDELAELKELLMAVYLDSGFRNLSESLQDKILEKV